MFGTDDFVKCVETVLVSGLETLAKSIVDDFKSNAPFLFEGEKLNEFGTSLLVYGLLSSYKPMCDLSIDLTCRTVKALYGENKCKH